jgi:hypothetical protein
MSLDLGSLRCFVFKQVVNPRLCFCQSPPQACR